MRARQKFCMLSVYLRSDLFDVLAVNAKRQGKPWHLAYAEVERRLLVAAVADAERLIQAYGADETEAVVEQTEEVDALELPHCAHGTATSLARLNVRTQPSTSTRILGQFQPGQVLTVWATHGEWALVQDDSGLTGWCAKAYLKIGELTRSGGDENAIGAGMG